MALDGLGAFIRRSCADWFIGKMQTSRRFSSPASSITMRSMPGAVPRHAAGRRGETH